MHRTYPMLPQCVGPLPQRLSWRIGSGGRRRIWRTALGHKRPVDQRPKVWPRRVPEGQLSGDESEPLFGSTRPLPAGRGRPLYGGPPPNDVISKAVRTAFASSRNPESAEADNDVSSVG